MPWAMLAAAAIGAGASIFGAKEQANAVSEANATNAEAAKEANRLNYEMWLRSRGTSSNGTPTNYILPEWAGVQTSSKRQLLRKGQAPQLSHRLNVLGLNNTGGGGSGGPGSNSFGSIGSFADGQLGVTADQGYSGYNAPLATRDRELNGIPVNQDDRSFSQVYDDILKAINPGTVGGPNGSKG